MVSESRVTWATSVPILVFLGLRPSPPSVGAESPRAAESTAPADGNVAVGSHAQYVPTLTAAAA